MKRTVIMVLCIFCINQVKAQSRSDLERGLTNAYERAMAKHRAEQENAQREAERKERLRQQTVVEFKTDQVRQINNLNQYNVQDFAIGMQEDESRSNVNQQTYYRATNQNTPKAQKNQKPVTAVKNKTIETSNQRAKGYSQKNGDENFKWSGNDYMTDKSGKVFKNGQNRKMTSSQIKKNYQQHAPNKNVGRVQSTTSLKSKNSPVVNYPAKPQQKKFPQKNRVQKNNGNPSGLAKVDSPVKKSFGKNPIVIDNSKPVSLDTGKDNMSSDLNPPRDISRKSEREELIVGPLPKPKTGANITDGLYDKPKYTDAERKEHMKKNGIEGITEGEYAKKAMRDAQNSFPSFEDPILFEDIYGYEPAGKVKMPKVTVSQNRTFSKGEKGGNKSKKTPSHSNKNNKN